MIEASAKGYYATCPSCRKELRIHASYMGQNVACRFCNSQFEFQSELSVSSVVSFYLDCPHCSRELKAPAEYLGAKVACKHCDGGIQLHQVQVVREDQGAKDNQASEERSRQLSRRRGSSARAAWGHPPNRPHLPEPHAFPARRDATVRARGPPTFDRPIGRQ